MTVLPTAPDAYELPDRPCVINFSGGRSSAFMLRRLLDHYDGALPDRARVIFANTGAELDQTLDFVEECSRRWGVDITWLEYHHNREAGGGVKDPKHTVRVVDHASASRNYEPFSELILAKAMLPNVAMRFCTSELKVRTVDRFVRWRLGWPSRGYANVLGIRADEERRVNRALMEECAVVYPMVYAGVSLSDVLGYWEASPFDLGIHGDRGNCDLCYLKGRAKIIRLIRGDAALADWWIEQEGLLQKRPKWKARRLRKTEMARFSQRWSYAELRRVALIPGYEPDLDEEFTPLAFARHLGVSRSTVYRMIRSGKLEAEKSRGRWKITRRFAQSALLEVEEAEGAISCFCGD